MFRFQRLVETTQLSSRDSFGKAMLMTYQTPTPAPTPCANTMRNGLREVYVRLKTPTRAYAVGVLLSKRLCGVRFVLTRTCAPTGNLSSRDYAAPTRGAPQPTVQKWLRAPTRVQEYAYAGPDVSTLLLPACYRKKTPLFNCSTYAALRCSTKNTTGVS